MLLFLFLLSNSFAAVIGCCSLLLFVSQVVVHYQFHCIFLFPARSPQLVLTGPGPQFVFTGPSPQFVFACFLQPKFVIITVSTYINSVSTFMYLLSKYNLGNK